jgi:glyoxylase-like metal-dependent hydrolase (beta-lactamase superfamily II)
MIYIIVVLFLFIGGSVNAQPEDFSKVEIKVTPVAGTVYMLKGAGGNIAASVGDDGIAIIDDQYAPLFDRIRAALKGIADKPVRFIINTHYHFDHTGGNAQFSKTSTVIAHENVRNRLMKEGFAGNGGSVRFDLKAEPPEAWPIVTYLHDVALHLNGETIRAIHYPSGHTDGDSIIYFEKANVVHMGDDFVTYGFPFIDISGGGSIDGMITAVESAIKQFPPGVKVIPGHGEICTKQDVENFLNMLKETREVVKKALAEKKTLDQMKEQKILEPWKKYSGDFISADAFIETLYNSLTGKKDAAFMRH